MYCAPMGGRRLLCWPPPKYLKQSLRYCVFFLLLFVVIGLVFVTCSTPSNQCSLCLLTVFLHWFCACSFWGTESHNAGRRQKRIELNLKKDYEHGEEEIHNIVGLNEYIETILYDILVKANTAVSYHPLRDETKIDLFKVEIYLLLGSWI